MVKIDAGMATVITPAKGCDIVLSRLGALNKFEKAAILMMSENDYPHGQLNFSTARCFRFCARPVKAG